MRTRIGTILLKKTARNARAFTLIELVIVIAITVVLFGLLLGPLINSLRVTQQAQNLAAAQDLTRLAVERISRELSSAVYVFDNTSHPMPGTMGGTTADRYTNFLDLPITSNQKDQNGNFIQTVEHAYNAKLDFVLARHNSAGGLIDPTTGQPINLTAPKSGSGSAFITDPGLVFPSAPGTTMIRYWTGLKDPTKPYNNLHDRPATFTGNIDNTYIEYRAEVSPFKPKNPDGTYTANPDGSTVNELYFAPKYDAAGKALNMPEFDDPDFFRYVSVTDINWLKDTHTTYAASDITAHNIRVDNWAKIAKPVITAPFIDLILLPHNTDGTVAYDSTSHVAQSGTATDPVTGTPYPVVNTSVFFRPATVSGDASPVTASNDISAGHPMNPVDTQGFGFVPTAYTASSQSWSQPYHIYLYPADYAQKTAQNPPVYPNYFSTDIGSNGDLEELLNVYSNGAYAPMPVFDITTGMVITGNNYVPLTVNAETGTINCQTPALPKGPTDRFTRYWPVSLADTSTGSLNLTDNVKFPNTPLPPNADNLTFTGTEVQNARLVPGSLRIYGPDATQGPNLGNQVVYSEAPSSEALGDNQYKVDYGTSTISFGTLPQKKADNSVVPDPAMQIAFDYQANLTVPDETKAISLGNPAAPMQAKVDFLTRDLLDLNIGVRLYDLTTNRAQVFSIVNKVKIGNSNR